MLSEEDKIRLIHENRTALLNYMFGELAVKLPALSAEELPDAIIALAEVVRTCLMQCEELENQPRGLFVLALQQVVDSFIAGLIADEAFR